ncbi:hypothetical protein PXK30_19190 [Phaeobacter gallaeciensis]|uniref:hypothetical protein n=1 Tax=Phaeobacter gallaeciensis TaxID=60890 RepID=UPI00237F4D1D|nr:hypothetical protein [Phaeobacter gallaeciensis]MDE4305827.1 hypothetical protein [Phaeobacter gallaeciensis]MDE4310192.1 hypothetical protein [Phaeobacter gallaeciensis]MDE4314704.1 hypothetical protein [Phaeobacter gallaeciensis]MDE4319095.1 hypothetical protein [Phaeobacter gallaeciensis]MDE4323577.1 hypothetical protein [Phaeobacter gallaeciensis]
MNYSMLAGLAARVLWGLTFIAPNFIGKASAEELVIVRYVAYWNSVFSLCWIVSATSRPYAATLDG